MFLCGVLSGCGELVGWLGVVEGAVSEYCVEGGDVSVGQGEDGLARAFALVAFALVVRPGGRVRSGGGESREEHGALRRLLPAWEVYSPGIDEPDLGVRGAGRMWEASWAPVVKVLPRVLARNTAAAGTPDAGHGWSGAGQERVGHPPEPRHGRRYQPFGSARR